jgi:hypothetical protein
VASPIEPPSALPNSVPGTRFAIARACRAVPSQVRDGRGCESTGRRAHLVPIRAAASPDAEFGARHSIRHPVTIG